MIEMRSRAVSTRKASDDAESHGLGSKRLHTQTASKNSGSKGFQVDHTFQTTVEPVIAALIRLRRFWKHPAVLGAS